MQSHRIESVGRKLAAASTAVVAGLLLTVAPVGAQTLLSDDFEGRQTGLPFAPPDGFSDWGSPNNNLGGSITTSYLTSNAANVNQQTVSAGFGELRFGRTLLNYNLATDASVVASGGFSVQYRINPSDAGGGGIAGRDWGGVGLVDTNSIVRIGGPAAVSTFGNDNVRAALLPRNSGSMLIRLNKSTDVDLPSTAGPNTPNDDDLSEYRRVVGNPLGAFNEPIFDATTHAAYTAAMGGNAGYAGDFVSPVFYTVRLEVTSSNFAAFNGLASVRAFVDNVEVDLDDTTPGVNGNTFRLGNDPSISGTDSNGLPYQGGLYLAFFGNSNVHVLDDLIVAPLAAVIQQWGIATGGNWNTGSNWTTGTAPNGLGAVARLGSSITGPATVTVDAPVTVGELIFNNTNAYTIDGSSTLTIAGGAQAIRAQVGSHRIEAPLALAGATTLDAAAGAGFAVAQPVVAPGVAVEKTGGGTVALARADAGTLTVSAGTLALTNGSSATASRFTAVSVATGAALDAGAALVVVDHDGSQTYAALRDAITGGRIVDSVNAGQVIGLADNAVLNRASFGGLSVDGSSLLLRSTLAGDADLSGTVNIGDFSLLAANFNTPGGWQSGDFNYDGQIGIADFSLLAANFNRAAASDGARGSAVPEPAGAWLLGLGALRVLRRHRGSPSR